MVRIVEEQVKELIICAKNGDLVGNTYRASLEMAVLMSLLYFGPMKVTDALNITEEALEKGTYLSKRKGQVRFRLPEEQQMLVRWYLASERKQGRCLKRADALLTKTKQNYDKLFKKIASTVGIEARLSDLYYAGLGRESKEMKR